MQNHQNHAPTHTLRKFYSNISFMFLKGIDSLKEIETLRATTSTSPSQTAQHRLRSQLCPTCPCLKSSVWEGLAWVTPLGLWAAGGEDTVREFRLELRAPTTAGIDWVQNVLAVALKWQIWGVAVGFLLSNQHWFTCCCFFPFWVRVRAASSSCPTQAAAQPQGLQGCPSAASLPGLHTVPGGKASPPSQRLGKGYTGQKVPGKMAMPAPTEPQTGSGKPALCPHVLTPLHSTPHVNLMRTLSSDTSVPEKLQNKQRCC